MIFLVANRALVRSTERLLGPSDKQGTKGSWRLDDAGGLRIVYRRRCTSRDKQAELDAALTRLRVLRTPQWALWSLGSPDTLEFRFAPATILFPVRTAYSGIQFICS